MARNTYSDPTKSPILKEIRERYDYAKREWSDIRAEAAIDMQFVKGNPWSEEDRRIRGDDRPRIAPEEMSQYRNQVTNALLANPRGMKFAPAGGGASQKSAEFYEGKGREIEYRSHAVEAYIGAAENVLQRSYGYWRVATRYVGPRSANQEIWIEGFPDPDVVLPDPDAKRRTSEDMKFCFVLETMQRAEFKRKYGKKAKIANFGDYVDRYKDWVIGSSLIQVGEYWSVETRPRKLYALGLALMGPDGVKQAAPKPLFVFEDEIEAVRKQGRGRVSIESSREVRSVDYPEVMQRITNGLEVLEENDWPGKYIPIVSIYGPILYVPEGGKAKKTIKSMTRDGRDPWKAMCYASSQSLEVLGMVPHGSVMAVEGQLSGHEDEWEDALYHPKLVLYYKDRVPGMPAGEASLGPPKRLEYTQGEYLQAVEMVKEGYRRAIQAAMGSNYLPTQAQRINDKSGKALEKIDDAATQGTYHFVYAYEDGIRHTGVIVEDLIDKIHDYTGETGWMDPKLETKQVRINDPDDEQAYPTRGDHMVTISSAPSSDSEYDAVQKVLEHLVGQLQVIAQIAGAPAAAALLAQSIRMLNLGPQGDELVDIVMPEAFKSQDGKPVDPQLVAAKGQIQQLTQQLQQAGFIIKTKQIEGQTKLEIEKMKAGVQTSEGDKDREVKLEVAELGAKVDRMWLLIEGMKLIDERAGRRIEHAHDAIERAKDRTHDVHTADRAMLAAGVAATHGAALDAASQARGAAIDDAAAVRDAALTPPPEQGGA
jgi:hypothetical protein